MITLRSARELLGWTGSELAEQIARHGVHVHPDHLYNVETGRRRASPRLLSAWAHALGLIRTDVLQERELRDPLSGR